MRRKKGLDWRKSICICLSRILLVSADRLCRHTRRSNRWSPVFIYLRNAAYHCTPFAYAADAAQAGAGTVMFDGTRVTLRGDACAVALRTIDDNSSGPNLVRANCAQANNRVLVQITLRPLRMFGGSFALPVDYVTAAAYVEPQFGINERE